MNEQVAGYALIWINVAAWVVCFWWLRGVARRQEALQKELQRQASHIAQLSQVDQALRNGKQRA